MLLEKLEKKLNSSINKLSQAEKNMVMKAYNFAKESHK
jgi:hypothetical protein